MNANDPFIRSPRKIRADSRDARAEQESTLICGKDDAGASFSQKLAKAAEGFSPEIRFVPIRVQSWTKETFAVIRRREDPQSRAQKPSSTAEVLLNHLSTLIATDASEREDHSSSADLVSREDQ